MYRFLSRYAHEKQNQWEDLKQTINLPLIGDFGQEWSYSLREEVNNSQMLELMLEEDHAIAIGHFVTQVEFNRFTWICQPSVLMFSYWTVINLHFCDRQNIKKKKLP